MDPQNNGSNDSHPVAKSLAKSRILLVDDNDNIRAVFQEGLERRGFEVIPAASVNAALNLISTEKFDVLLSDLHMPNAGDGLTVVSAMRHAHPSAITLVQSGYPAMEVATADILLQVDEIIAKPIGLAQIAEIISKKLSNPKAHMALNKERVSTILQSAMDSTIRNWMTRVESNEELTAIKLTPKSVPGIFRCSWATSCAACTSPPQPRPSFQKLHASTGFCDASKATRSPWSSKNRACCKSLSLKLCRTI